MKVTWEIKVQAHGESRSTKRVELQTRPADANK